MQKSKLEGADKQWGFRFGCEGVASVIEAMAFMSVGRTKFYELRDAGKIRTGKIDGKTVVCRRSVNVFLSTVEV